MELGHISIYFYFLPNPTLQKFLQQTHADMENSPSAHRTFYSMGKPWTFITVHILFCKLTRWANIPDSQMCSKTVLLNDGSLLLPLRYWTLGCFNKFS